MEHLWVSASVNYDLNVAKNAQQIQPWVTKAFQDLLENTINL